MCIAILKPAGFAAPDLKTLRICFDNNDDGAGFLVAREGKINIHKGFMQWADFESAWKEYGPKDTELAGIHFRISTAGGVRPQNCHPFPISQAPKELECLSIKSKTALIHNGMFGAGEGNLSDTMTFIRDHLADPYILRGLWTNKECRMYIGRLVRGSRVAVFHANGSSWYWGEWTKESGVLYSNSSYKKSYYSKSSHFGMHGAYGRDDDDFDFNRITGGAWNNKKPAPKHYHNYNHLACPECGSTESYRYSKDTKDWRCACGAYFDTRAGECYTVDVGEPLSCPLCHYVAGTDPNTLIRWSPVRQQWTCENCAQSFDPAPERKNNSADILPFPKD